jgi:predicted transcriptional regulator
VSGLSDQSVRNKLNHLVELGVLEKEGSTRATRYRFTDPFGEIKEMLKKEFPED